MESIYVQQTGQNINIGQSMNNMGGQAGYVNNPIQNMDNMGQNMNNQVAYGQNPVYGNINNSQYT